MEPVYNVQRCDTFLFFVRNFALAYISQLFCYSLKLGEMGEQVEVSKQHKACVYNLPGNVSTKIEMVDTPEPGPGEVLVNLYDSY